MGRMQEPLPLLHNTSRDAHGLVLCVDRKGVFESWIWNHISFKDCLLAWRYLGTSFRKTKVASLSDIAVFLKEVFDHHCFQFAALGFRCA